MEQVKSVEKYGFIFCRYSVAIMLWLAFILKIEWLIYLVFVILAVSAIIGIYDAPMIFLWRHTFNHFIKSKKELLNAKAMRFAHILGSIFAAICIILLFTYNPLGWGAVFFFAVIKSISALGFCPASKLYTCVSSSGCCALGSKFKK